MQPLAIAEAFYEPLESSSTEIEQARRLPQPLADQMAAAGLFRMVVPECYGGLQAHPWDYIQTLAYIAEADASAGWNLMIGTTTSLLSATLEPQWAKNIYADHPDVITVGVTAPIGQAEPQADGSLIVSGRWPFGSGCQIADWICGGCFLDVGEAHPQPTLVFFKPEEVTIHDTWDTSGLCGTGSHDIEVQNVHVPAGRYVQLGGRPKVDAPLYRFPTFGLLALGVSAVSLGIANRAVKEFVELAGAKTPTGASRSLANRPSVQKDLAQAQTALAAATALTRERIEAAYAQAAAGQRMSTKTKAGLRQAAANNAWSAASCVDTLYHAAGGSSIYKRSLLQKCFRDVHVTTQHIMVGQPIYEVVGKVMLGLDPKQPL